MKALCALLCLVLASCNNSPTTVRTPGGYSVNIGNQTPGSTRAYLTDDVLTDNNVTSVYVTISELAVHASASAPADDSGWTTFAINPIKTFDLMNLTNKANAILTDLALTPGAYQQIRMTIRKCELAFANGSIIEANVPSDKVRFNLGVTLESDKTYGMILDFVASNSLTKSETGNTWTLAPVIQVKEVFIINTDGTTSAVTMGG